MIVNSVLGNIKDFDTKGKTIDKVKLNADDRQKKIIRLQSDSGVDIGINLSGDKHLHNGDILAESDDKIFVIDFLPQDIIIIKPNSIAQMGFVAHSIGNRHIPAVFENDTMIVEDDYLIIQLLDENKVNYEKTKRVLDQILRHASHKH